MRVLITGSRGQVGQSLRERIPEEWEAIFTDSKTLDITNEQAVHAMVKSFQPDVIINTAAYTNVDKAEEEIDLAFAVNATGVGYLAKAANAVGTKLIHISTDHVFDGKKNTPYSVIDYTNPCNTYGKSKLAGELLALGLCNESIVIRTSWVISAHNSNFVKAILTKASSTPLLSVVSDQYGKPTYALDLADFIIKLCIDKNLSKQSIYHFCSEDSLSRFEFAKKIIAIASEFDKYYSTVTIKDVATDQYPPQMAKRPSNGILETNFRLTSQNNAQYLYQIVEKIIHSTN